MQLSGRTVLITGGAGGIGVPLARALLAEGNTVVVCGRSQDAARLIRAETEVNLNGTVLVTATLLPLLLARPEACLAFVTSGIAYAPASDVPGYSMTKAALHSLARSLRHTLRDTCVSVVEIVPPAVDTDMIRALECRKMRPEVVAGRVVAGLKRDRRAIRMGQTHVTYRLNRLWPTGAERLIRGSFD